MCTYIYPEQQQLNFVLTSVFHRVSKYYKKEEDPAAGTNQPKTYYSVILLIVVSYFRLLHFQQSTHYLAITANTRHLVTKQSRIRPYIMDVLIFDILVAGMSLWMLFEIGKKQISNSHSIINFTV
jgi:hypothetical protein